MSHWSCSCESPPVITLTDSFLAPSLPKTTRSGASAEALLLRSTLSQYGWCHVAVDSSKLSQFANFSKANFVKLFEKDHMVAPPPDGAVYRGRAAESGSSLAADGAEPKQSWEVQRCGGGNTPLHESMDALHSIALHVTKMLGLPKDTFLREAACRQQYQEDGGDCGSSNHKCNGDLLRIFLYDPVATTTTMGSSAHTDWGSWTVVWQDDVGGLQTYCPLHEIYVDVKAPNKHTDGNAKFIYFVVHVGDVTSLALGHAAAGTLQTKNNDNGHSTSQAVLFPSPRHRVLCPQEESRVSLVYFAYPPPSISLAEMETRLMEEEQNKRWTLNHQVGDGSSKEAVVMYDSYYLLQNQKSGGGKVEDPEQIYQRMRTKPLGECFQSKWEQVQRNI